MLPYRRDIEKDGNIDVYWLFDDGGLTLLVPHILHTRKMFRKCNLRLFFLSSKADKLDSETRSMIALLGKFRIETDDVIILSDATKKPCEETKEQFEKMLQKSDDEKGDNSEDYVVPEDELKVHREKTMFHLRLSEVKLNISFLSYTKISISRL